MVIITIPPTKVAAVNRQPSITQSTTPNSSRRLAEANWKAMPALKRPPFQNINRAIATAA